MDSIWENKEYMSRTAPPYHDTFHRYGELSDAVIFWYAYTPTGRVSKYWQSLQIRHGEKASHEWLEKRAERFERECGHPRLRKGYTWSKAYLYSPIPERVLWPNGRPTATAKP